MDLYQATHRKIKGVFPEEREECLLYQSERPSFAVIDLSYNPFFHELRINSELRDVIDKENVLHEILKHDLDFYFSPKKEPELPNFLKEAGEEYLELWSFFKPKLKAPFGFMSDLPDIRSKKSEEERENLVKSYGSRKGRRNNE